MSDSNHSNNEGLVKLLSAYFSQRGSFLAQVIRADIKNLPHLTKPTQTSAKSGHQHQNISPSLNGVTTNQNGSQDRSVISVSSHVQEVAVPPEPASKPATLSVSSHAQEVAVPPEPVSKSEEASLDVKSILINLVVEQTGFPAESISLDVRLLDDLNMDSIKAGELIASVTKACNVVGVIDPSSLANASLGEIIQVIESNVGGTTETTSVEHNSEIQPQISPAAQPEKDLTSLLLTLVEERTGFPQSSLSLELRLLDDLNLDSIKAADLIATAAQKAEVSGEIDPSTLANSTLGELLEALQQSQVVSQPPQISPAAQPEKDLTSLLLTLVEERTGFPQSSLSLDLRLLDDLNLDSIKAADLIATAAQKAEVSGEIDPSTLANSTLGELIEALQQNQVVSQPEEKSIPQPQKTIPQPQKTTTKVPVTAKENYSRWVRNFAIEYIPQEISAVQANWSQARVLIVSEEVEGNFSQGIKGKLEEYRAQVETISYDQVDSRDSSWQSSFTHYLAILPQTPPSSQEVLPLAQMTARIKSIATLPPASKNCCFTYVQFSGGYFGSQGAAISPELCCAGAFARSLHLERPDSRVQVIDLPQNIEYSQASELVIQEMSTTEAMVVAGYNKDLLRLVPEGRIQQPATYKPRSLSWSGEDVILVTGGAKGITAECAVAVAKTTGVKMALVGRSQRDNSEVMKTLKRFQDEGLTCEYYSADITNSQAIVELVQKITSELGLITGFIHGAGLNTPRRIEQVTLEAAQKEVSPKLLGAYHILQALATTPPKLVMAFSSIIGVIGMPGNAWYGFANESLNLLLRQFQAQNSDTQVLSTAYSVWDEVGMGARMGSIKTLEKMGIGPVSLKEGRDRFLKLFESDPGVLQVLIGSHIGIDTWCPVKLGETNLFRFIEEVVYVEPHVELTVRTHLTIDQDLYVQDHVWRGSYLFPTVFGLEAMAQATAYVTGEKHNKIARIEDISLQRPIVVNRSNGLEIEIHAEVDEALPNGEIAVKVGIRTEQTGFKIDHFAGTFIIGDIKSGVKTNLQLGEPLAINPQTDLYGDLLFQGERFQRMGAIYSLSREKSIFRSYAITSDTELVEESFGPGMESYMILGDPYLRDVLLQSSQLNISQYTCLPISIGKIEFFQNPDSQGDDRIVTSLLVEQTDKECVGEVFVSDKQGNILEKLTGYRVRIMEENLSHPSPEELANPEKRDAKNLQDKLKTAFAALELKQPGVGFGYAPNLQVLPKQQRRLQEKPIVAKAIQAQLGLSPEDTLDFEITALESGKPQLAGASVAGLHVSLSHCDRYCLSAVGNTPQGVDLELITHRSSEDWVNLLSFKHSTILNQLVEQGDSTDVAGTRIWSSVEAVRKAFNGTHPELSIVKHHQDSVLLEATTVKGNYLVVTQPLKLTRHPERMIAILVPEEQPVSPPSESDSGVEVFTGDGNNSHIQEDYLGELIYEKLFQLSFQESGSLSGRVYFSEYFTWIGQIRELAMKSIASEMLSDLFSGNSGIVTKAVSLRILGEATAYDTIQARVCSGNVVGSTFDSYMEFCKVLPDGDMEKIALAKVRTKWIGMSNGIPEQASLPSYLQNFFDKFATREPVNIDLKKTETFALSKSNTSFANIQTGAIVYQSPSENRYGKLLHSEIYQTTLEESNLFGNVYYSNYFIWQGRTLDLFLYSVASEYPRFSKARGELICFYTRIDFLQEAMPFDKILVLLYVKSVSECGAVFNFEFFRQEPDGKRKKLHVGQQEAMWACRDQDGNLVPTPWPQAILEAFMTQV
ncbi:MAG: SDR family NAD(P)-dependent oxidoreductase [Cyanobacteriota bacterium]|nr:SDR family NAD(P)-dependent oxidoreductase [Cyanobacteriota bacterium]